MSVRLKLRNHLIAAGRFFKAGLYREGELPDGFGEVVEPDDEPVISKVEKAPKIDSERSRFQEAESIGPRKIRVHQPIGEVQNADEHEEARTAWRKGKLIRKTK